jgi:GMP synthase-like glutamine amidotransferase
MSVLVVKNIAGEGPGTIEDYLNENNISCTVLNMYEPGEMPDVSKFSHLVIMGGPMAVYEIEKYPFLHIESALIRSFIKEGKAVLGICLGAQMVAYALSANVYSGAKNEVGWDKVDITSEGMDDPVLSNLSVSSQPYADVFQWHGDTFDLPANSLRLSSSAAYKNQAFRYRDNVYALQFHIEVTPRMIREWFADESGDNIDDMFRRSENIFPEYHKRAIKFYEKFFT